MTSSTTGSFPAVQALSPSPFPTRKAGHSTAIRPYGSPTGKRVSSRQQEEVSFITARPAAFSLARSDPSRRLLLSQASHSSSGEGGHWAVLIRILGRWQSIRTLHPQSDQAKKGERNRRSSLNRRYPLRLDPPRESRCRTMGQRRKCPPKWDDGIEARDSPRSVDTLVNHHGDEIAAVAIGDHLADVGIELQLVLDVFRREQRAVIELADILGAVDDLQVAGLFIEVAGIAGFQKPSGVISSAVLASSLK